MTPLSVQPNPPVGLIGLGLMGRAIANRLVRHDYPVLGFDISADANAAFGDPGDLTQVATPQAIFAACDRVILSLPAHTDVDLVLSQNESNLRAGQVVVDTTTGDPAYSESNGQRLAEINVHYLDATISGSSHQLESGDVVWMVGGSTVGMSECRDLFDVLGRHTFHVGASGSGARMKLVTNLVLGLNRAALAEGLVYADSLGLNIAETLTVLQSSMAYSRIMDTKGRKMIERDYTPQARLSQHLKDVNLIVTSAAKNGVDLRLSRTHREILEQAMTLGLGDADNSALIEVLRGEQNTQ
jgi:3-hydroxyisobutyrate dehydrogenase-like beta-hydroxyacid dehydrogenase